MKLKSGFLLRQVAGQCFVIPSGDHLNLDMIITLNDTGRFLWERLESGAQEDELAAALAGEYEVAEDRARESVIRFVKQLEEHGFLEN